MHALSADDAMRHAAIGYSVWVKRAEAHHLRLPKPWVTGYPPATINGEEAELFVHPARQGALKKYMDGDDLSVAEAGYVAAYFSADLD